MTVNPPTPEPGAKKTALRGMPPPAPVEPVRPCEDYARTPPRQAVPRYHGCTLRFVWVGCIDLFYEAQARGPQKPGNAPGCSKTPSAHPGWIALAAVGLTVSLAAIMAWVLPALAGLGWVPDAHQTRNFSVGLATVAGAALLLWAPVWALVRLKAFLRKACLRGWEVLAGLRAPSPGWKGPR